MKVELKQLKLITKKLSVAIGVMNNLSILNISTAADTNTIYFNLYNGESYISFKLVQEEVDPNFEVSIDNKAFIDLVNSLNTEYIDLSIKDNVLKISADKSNYKLAVIYDNNELWKPVAMFASNAEFETSISKDILASIDLVNTQELARVKEDRVKNGAGKLYYLSNNGCFTSANIYGACLNSFQLDNTFELLLTKKIVKLFKLFDGDISLLFCEDSEHGVSHIKVSLKDDTTLVTAIAPSDKSIRAAMLKMVYRLKEFASAIYQTHLVINTKELSSALSRLNIAAKHLVRDKDANVRLDLILENNQITIKDEFENSEVISLQEGSLTISTQVIRFYLEDLKPVVDLVTAEKLEIDTNTNGVVILSFDNIKYFLTQLAAEN